MQAKFGQILPRRTQNRSEKIVSIPKPLALIMQWGRAAAGMEAIGALPGSEYVSANV
jgi:hypothetical protein